MSEIHMKCDHIIRIDDTEIHSDTLGKMFEILNIPNTTEYHEARVGIVQHLLAMHYIDLTPAYPGHNVTVTIEFKEG